MPTIRLATPADAPAVLELGLRVSEVNFSHIIGFSTLEELEAEAMSPEAYFVVAELDGVIVGFLIVDCYTSDREVWANITSLAVREDLRNRGIFSGLFRAWNDEALRRGITYECAYARAGHPIVDYLTKRGFSAGHDYTFVDRKVSDRTSVKSGASR